MLQALRQRLAVLATSDRYSREVKLTPLERVERFCQWTCLAFSGSLIWLIPFDPYRNIEFQGLILILAGFFACLAVLTNTKRYLGDIPKYLLILLAIYVATCLTSLFLNPDLSTNFFGAPYIRLGAAGLLSCIVCGLVLSEVIRGKLVELIYGTIVLASLISLPYSLLILNSFARPGGIFAQADIFACFLGIAILFGTYLIHKYPGYFRPLIIAQIWLFTLLIMSQTRAVILLTILIVAIWLGIVNQSKYTWKVILFAVAIILLCANLIPGRIGDAGYAMESIEYRIELQKAGLDASNDKIITGYGPGTIASALECSKLESDQLQMTCNEGYYFNSSHNIYLDRVLGLGWLGGLAFTVFIAFAIRRAFLGNLELKIIALSILLIAGYYLTNVTSIAIELMLWILLIVGIKRPFTAKIN